MDNGWVLWINDELLAGLAWISGVRETPEGCALTLHMLDFSTRDVAFASFDEANKCVTTLKMRIHELAGRPHDIVIRRYLLSPDGMVVPIYSVQHVLMPVNTLGYPIIIMTLRNGESLRFEYPLEGAVAYETLAQANAAAKISYDIFMDERADYQNSRRQMQ